MEFLFPNWEESASCLCLEGPLPHNSLPHKSLMVELQAFGELFGKDPETDRPSLLSPVGGEGVET